MVCTSELATYTYMLFKVLAMILKYKSYLHNQIQKCTLSTGSTVYHTGSVNTYTVHNHRHIFIRATVQENVNTCG